MGKLISENINFIFVMILFSFLQMIFSDCSDWMIWWFDDLFSLDSSVIVILDGRRTVWIQPAAEMSTNVLDHEFRAPLSRSYRA